MNSIQIELSTYYTATPSYCKIYFCNELIFDNLIDKDISIKHNFESIEQLTLKIIKDGKTKKIVDNKDEQIIDIKKINVNGIDLKINEFGLFQIKNNAYVKDYEIQTTKLTLNGEWTISLLKQPLLGTINIDKIKTKLRDNIEDCDIACFGCSQTYGVGLEINQTWPYYLSKETNSKVKNFGIGGSNLNEQTAFIDYYIKNYNAKLILLLMPHSMRRQVYEQGQIENVTSSDKRNKEFIFHGEEHSIINLSCSMNKWFKNINRKILIGCYQSDEYVLIARTPLKSKLLPYLEYKNYPLANDNLHFGANYCKEYARLISKHIKEYDFKS